MHFHPRALLYFYLVGNIGGRYEHSFISMANWGYLYFFFFWLWNEYRMMCIFNVARIRLCLRVNRRKMNGY